LNAESRAAYLKTRTELIDAGYDPLSRSTICDHAHDCDLIVVEFERVRRPAPNPLKEVQAEAQPEPEPAPVRMIEEVIDLPTLVPIPAGQGFSENIVIIGLEDSPRQTMPGFPSLSAYMAAGRTFADWQRDSDQAVITRGRQTAMRLMEQMS
ncbi:MAG: hypothetical protein SF029_25980, partial [bacterium]|nr:hypothetical protein [bacterium]